MASFLDFIIPNYCDVYKSILVEEICLIPNPIKLHYGKCSVIGKLVLDAERYYLQNIRLSFLDRKHQLRTGEIRVLLLPSIRDRPLPVNQFVEVFGETVLWACEHQFNQNKVQDDIILPTTSKDLMLSIRDKQYQLEQSHSLPEREPTGMDDDNMHPSVKMTLRDELNMFEEKYVPAIQIHSFNVIDQAEELIRCNLEIRLIKQGTR